MRQFALGLEAWWGLQPLQRLRTPSGGLIQGAEDAITKSAREAFTGQFEHIAHGVAPQSRQSVCVATYFMQAAQRQGRQASPRGRPRTVDGIQLACLRAGGQGCSCPRPTSHAVVTGAISDQGMQTLQATKQPCTGLHFQHQAVFQPGHLGRELKRPGHAGVCWAISLERWRRAVSERDPVQHGMHLVAACAGAWTPAVSCAAAGQVTGARRAARWGAARDCRVV